MANFHDAVLLHRQGNNAAAKELSGRILKREPRNLQVLAFHGTVCAVLGERDEAIKTFRTAAKIRPEHAPFHYMLGNLLREIGRGTEAIEHYRSALSAYPAFVEACINLGLALTEQGQLEAGIDSYRRALEIDADNAIAWYNLGNALQTKQEFGEAVHCYGRVLEIRPGDVNALFNLGNACLACDRLVAAIDAYGQVIRLNARHAPASANLGVALRRLGRYGAARNSLEQALQIDPLNVSALTSLGNVLCELGELESAVSVVKKSVSLEPLNADAWFNLGNILYLCKQFEQAGAALRRAVDLKPNNASYLGSLAGVQMALWESDEIDKTWTRLMDNWGTGRAIPTDVVFESTDDPEVHSQCAVSHAETLAVKTAHIAAALPVISPSLAGAPYRIGYLSPDFGEHPVGLSMVELFERHSTSRFEVTALALQQHPASVTRDRIISACAQYIDISGLDLKDGAELIRKLGLDAIVDLAGYTAGSCPGMLAARLAPVQISYLGFAGTIGASWVDYIIADDYVIPADSAADYFEKVVRVEEGFYPTDATLVVPDMRVTRKEEGLPENAFVFCCFNQARRISKETMTSWLDILVRVDHSVLWLQGFSDPVRIRMRSFARLRGVNPERLIFARYVPTRAEHLARHRLADLYLDTFPYNSHSTARDALYAGLPVLTRSGRSYASRVAGALLTVLQLPQLIAASTSEYDSRAIELARSPSKLSDLRIRLAEHVRVAPLFDTARLARDLELAYSTMIERARGGLSPANLKIKDSVAEWH